jgi:hypothetical protein
VEKKIREEEKKKEKEKKKKKKRRRRRKETMEAIERALIAGLCIRKMHRTFRYDFGSCIYAFVLG